MLHNKLQLLKALALRSFKKKIVIMNLKEILMKIIKKKALGVEKCH